MPLHWTIDPEHKMMTAVAEGEVTRAEFEAYLDAMGAAEAQGYRKLFDGSRGGTAMPAEEILALGVRMRDSHQMGAVGALAVVVPDAMIEPLGRVLGMLAAARRPMRVFGEVGAARKWIGSLPE